MSDQKPRKPQPGQAYTGKTIVMPKHEPGKPAQPPKLPEVPRVYQNPPPSQRRAQAGQAGRHAALPTQPARPMDNPPGESRRAAPKQQPQAPRLPLQQRMRLMLRRVGLAVAALLVVAMTLLWWQAHGVAQAVVVPEVRNNPSWATPLIGGVNVLLIGVDERPDHPEEGVRSDTLILARMSGPGGWVNMLSIPRDTQVDIPGVGVSKINVAYGEGYARAEELFGAGTTPQQGGMALAAQTVEQFLGFYGRGLRVDYTAQINFEGFVGIIDALGGITIDVPYAIVDYEYPTPDFGTMYVEFQPGLQHMDGQTALIYARTRHADSDFGRSERQQQVIRAIVTELQARGWAGRIGAMPAMLSSLERQPGAAQPVLTTMPFDRPDTLLGLMLLGGRLDSESIGRIQISPDNVGMIELGSNLVWDESGISAVVDQWLRPPQPALPAEAGQP